MHCERGVMAFCCICTNCAHSAHAPPTHVGRQVVSDFVIAALIHGTSIVRYATDTGQSKSVANQLVVINSIAPSCEGCSPIAVFLAS